MQSIKDLSFSGQRVFMRVDFNVPIRSGNITDDSRIQGALPSIKHILSNGGSLILASHLGRPQKDKNEDGTIKVEKYTLSPVAQYLNSLLDSDVLFCAETRGDQLDMMVKELKAGQVLLIENTRFEVGEKKGDHDLAKYWSSLADIYVNDAFGAAHREHASTATIARYFTKDAKAAGFLLQKEVEVGQKAMFEPKRPVVAIVGGAKVSDKLGLLENMIEKADKILIGGGMAYTFLKAKGGKVGKSLVEEDKLDLAKEILHKAIAHHTEFELPEDSVVASDFAETADHHVAASNMIEDGWMGLDIGPKAIVQYKNKLKDAGTIIWNGPMGVFEWEAFSKGTMELALAVSEATQEGAFSLIGGGDSASAVYKSGQSEHISHISTGGGAMLELLEGKTLPGVAALEEDIMS